MADPLIPVGEALDRLLEGVVPVADTVVVRLHEALGRVASEDIHSGIDVPPAPNSAMDGYAFCHGDIGTTSGVMRVSARIAAGSEASPLVPGTLARIFTGAPMPRGADTVVMQEDTISQGDGIKIRELPPVGDNVRPAGQDIAAGDCVVSKGRRLSPSDLGLVASVGKSEIRVQRVMSIAVMSTGDELVEPPALLKPGQIYNSSHYAITGLLRRDGFNVVDLGLVEDSPGATVKALRRGAAEADCVLSTGGVSVGEEDHVKAAVEALGRLELWRLRIKPGKPLAFGYLGETAFFGLPGNPVSSYVTFLMIARPWLLATQGCSEVRPTWYDVPANFEYKGGSRLEYLRVRFCRDEAGAPGLDRYPNQGSGILSSVSWATGLAEVDVGQEVIAGQGMKYYPFA